MYLFLADPRVAQNISVTKLGSGSVNVSWLPPRYTNFWITHYVLELAGPFFSESHNSEQVCNSTSSVSLLLGISTIRTLSWGVPCPQRPWGIHREPMCVCVGGGGVRSVSIFVCHVLHKPIVIA